MRFPNIGEYRETQKKISPFINYTPLTTSSSFNNLFNIDAHFKLELFQKTGSFKVRGAVNKILSLSSNEKKHGILFLLVIMLKQYPGLHHYLVFILKL